MTINKLPQPIVFGEVLYDCFADGNKLLGGAPFNVAWHLQALGTPALFLSRVGNDALGKKVAAAMRDWGMHTAGLQYDPHHPTGRVTITFGGHGEPEYAIADQQAYDHIEAARLPELQTDALLYHGSLALRNTVSRETLSGLKANHTGTVFMDVNLRAPWWSRDSVLELVDEAHWVKLNANELAFLGGGGDGLRAQATEFIGRHSLQGLVLTLGERGAIAVTDQGEYAQSAPSTALAVTDTVGAGDAFTAVFITGLINRWPLPQTMQRAQAFASSIVQRRGATVHDPAFYKAVTSAWRT